MRVRVAAVLAAVFAVLGPSSAAPAGEIGWQGWSDAAFTKAKAERRLVLLDLGAVWCHWCHVMEETTYRDPKVVSLLERHFVAVRVDQDARPDLSNRYEDYGWPATIIFDASGKELVKFAGYIPPERMISLLEGVVLDPTPGPSAAPESPGASVSGAGGSLPEALRQELSETLVSRYDTDHGGWGFSKKYLDWESIEWSLSQARAGDEGARRRARETLALCRKLIDPVWGGLYQYSDSGDWDHPHFEKLLQFQAEGMRIYAQAYALWGDPADLLAARDIHRYVKAFLTSPEGAFYVSQDADLVAGEHSGEYYALGDAERRLRGIPRVDTHLYARETAWGASALVSLYAITGEAADLDDALRAARWILANRQLPGGGFRHGAADPTGPFLGDTVACGRAFLALYAATGDRAWLTRARSAADFARRTFSLPKTAGLVTSVARSKYAPARPQRDENVALARFSNLLFRYTGRRADKELASRAMTFLAVPEVARRFSTASVLQVYAELSSEPAHVTVVGRLQDERTRALLVAALADASGYKRVEAWDPAQGPLPNADVQFPELDRPAAFACSNGRCSLPAFDPGQLRDRVERLRASSGKPPSG